MQVANLSTTQESKRAPFKAIFLVLAWILIFSLFKDVLQIRSGFDRVAESEKRLEAEVAKNSELKAKYAVVQSQEYREKMIRERLNMHKEGETVVVLPPKDGDLATKLVKKEGVSEAKNWEKWWNLIR